MNSGVKVLKTRNKRKENSHIENFIVTCELRNINPVNVESKLNQSYSIVFNRGLGAVFLMFPILFLL